MKYYSQFEQDKFTYENYFQDTKEGYFVDIGAHDGTTFSNSRFFEELGWSGVCVEPNPKVFEVLQSTRKCKCLKKAIADHTGKGKFFQIVEGADMLSGLVDEFNERGIKNIHANLQGMENEFDYIDVELDLFDNIVDSTTIDFGKYDIKVITVENNDYDNKFINFFTPKGYERVVRLGCDELYVKK